MFTLHCTARLRDRLKRPPSAHRQPATIYRDHGGAADPVELSMRLAETPYGGIRYDSPSHLLRTIIAQWPH